jgi:hypothetical protein
MFFEWESGGGDDGEDVAMRLGGVEVARIEWIVLGRLESLKRGWGN